MSILARAKGRSASGTAAADVETGCATCDGGRTQPLVDLGPMPLVNDLLPAADADSPTWPLAAVTCVTCGTARLVGAPPPSRLFDAYPYFSSQSETMVEHARRLVGRFVRQGARVVEIASNDGYLLAEAQRAGADVIGVEPAANVAEVARRRGVRTIEAFFDDTSAETLREVHGPADVIFALNVLAHVPDPRRFVHGVARLLGPGGVAHIEVPDVGCLLRDASFDTIYHEHRWVFSVTGLRNLARAHGLVIVTLEALPIHGGSVHVGLAHRGREATAVQAWCERERATGVLDGRLAAGFAARVARLRDEVDAMIRQHDVSVAYGAAAKGVVLLNWLGLTADRIRWVADISPHKQGRFVPGTRQPIVSPDRLVAEQPDACLLLPWNLTDEIVRQQRVYLERGGRFIVTQPTPRIIAVEARRL